MGESKEGNQRHLQLSFTVRILCMSLDEAGIGSSVCAMFQRLSAADKPFFQIHYFKYHFLLTHLTL